MTWEPHKIWIEQCNAARGIKESSGSQKALGYLIGEKLMEFVSTADDHPEFAEELPKFIVEIRTMFHPSLLNDYLENAQRLGPLGHVMPKEDHDFMRAAGAVNEGPIDTANDVILLKRVKDMLLA
jgi:hypothetical protein